MRRGTYLFIKLPFLLIGISFLSMYREALDGSHWGVAGVGWWWDFKLANPKHEYRNERQFIQSIYQCIIFMLCFIPKLYYIAVPFVSSFNFVPQHS